MWLAGGRGGTLAPPTEALHRIGRQERRHFAFTPTTVMLLMRWPVRRLADVS
jgi:hypothetical protein